MGAKGAVLKAVPVAPTAPSRIGHSLSQFRHRIRTDPRAEIARWRDANPLALGTNPGTIGTLGTRHLESGIALDDAHAMRGALHDLVHAWRGLKRQPGFLIAAWLTLSLGIGANTTIFGLVNGIYLDRKSVV